MGNVIFNLFKKKEQPKETVVLEIEEKVPTQEELEQQEFLELKARFDKVREIEIKRDLKEELEEINLPEQHSCQYCRFAKANKEDARLYHHKTIECTIKETIIVHKHGFNCDYNEFRKEYDKYIEKNDCEYFRVITKFKGQRIEDINNVE